MATVTTNNRTKLGWFLSHNDHPEWDRFSAEQQEEMVSEDLEAGRNVSLVLICLITTGLVLITVTLAAVLGS